MKTKKLTFAALLVGFALLLSLTLSSQAVAQVSKHTEGSIEFYSEFILTHQVETSTSGSTTPSGNIGKSFWYNLSDARTPFDEFFNGEFVLNETMNLTIFANLKSTKMRAIVLNEQNGTEGYLWDVARIFYLGQDIVIRTNLSASIPTDALDEVVIPAGTPLTQFQPTWEWANWTTFLDLMSNSSDGPGFIAPFEDRAILSTTPSLLFLDKTLWYDNINILGDFIAAVENDTAFDGDIYSENNTDGLTYQLYLQVIGNVSDPLSPVLELTFNWTDAGSNFARLDWMEFNLTGDFDDNGTIEDIEQLYFYWEFIGEDPAATLPYAVGQKGSYVIDSAVLDITPAGDLATYLDENGALPYINSAESQFNSLTGKTFMDYLITSIDGLYYEANVTIYMDLAKTLANMTNPGQMPPDIPDFMTGQGIASSYLGLRGENATIINRFVFHQNPSLPPFDDFNRSLRANATGWLLLPDNPNIQNVKIFKASDIDPMRPVEEQVNALLELPIQQQFYGEYVQKDPANFTYFAHGYLVQIDPNSVIYETFFDGNFSEPLVAYYEFVPRPGYRLYILENPFFLPMFGTMDPMEPMGPGDGMASPTNETMMENHGPGPLDLVLNNMQLPYYYPTLFDVQANASASASSLASEVEAVFNDVFSDPDVLSGITSNSSIQNITVSLDLMIDHTQTATTVTTNATAWFGAVIDVYNDTYPDNIVMGNVSVDAWWNSYVIYDTNGTLLEQGTIVDIYFEWSIDGLTFEELISGGPSAPPSTTTTTPAATTTTTTTTTTVTPPPEGTTTAPQVITPGFEAISMVAAIALSFIGYRLKKKRET